MLAYKKNHPQDKQESGHSANRRPGTWLKNMIRMIPDFAHCFLKRFLSRPESDRDFRPYVVCHIRSYYKRSPSYHIALSYLRSKDFEISFLDSTSRTTKRLRILILLLFSRPPVGEINSHIRFYFRMSELIPVCQINFIGVIQRDNIISPQ